MAHRDVLSIIFCGLSLVFVSFLFVFFYTQHQNLIQSQILKETKAIQTYIDTRFDRDKAAPVISNEHPPLEIYSSSSYPKYDSLLNIIKRWNPDNPDVPKDFKETLQHFNYSDLTQRKMAAAYRDAEVPFKLYDVPEFTQTSELWTDEYLASQLSKDGSQHVEKSINNHFMFWNMRGQTMRDYTPPTQVVKLPFSQWLIEAYNADQNKLPNSSTHYYFMTGSPPHDNKKSFVSRDLSLFSTKTNNFFITNVDANKGIQCRFSMRGIIAESHYDSGRNMVAMLKGAKRYIISPPYTCKQLGIISDLQHPSFRHSVIDWSDEQQAESHHFAEVDAIDTVVHHGEVLYIPSYWLHYIVSLQYSIQCNSRSGFPPNNEGAEDIEECVGRKKSPGGKKLRGGRRSSRQD